MTPAPDRGKRTPPSPIRYCPVEHGGVLFPGLLLLLVEHPGIDPFDRLALIRRHLCHGTGTASIPCDPATCEAALERAAAAPMGQFVNACRTQWTRYYDGVHGGAGMPQTASWALDLDGFDWDDP